MGAGCTIFTSVSSWYFTHILHNDQKNPFKYTLQMDSSAVICSLQHTALWFCDLPQISFQSSAPPSPSFFRQTQPFFFMPKTGCPCILPTVNNIALHNSIYKKSAKNTPTHRGNLCSVFWDNLIIRLPAGRTIARLRKIVVTQQ